VTSLPGSRLAFAARAARARGARQLAVAFTSVAALAATACVDRPAAPPGARSGARPARDVTIQRDDWGVPHVRGKTDADAVFGLVYAQAEDDFHRIETNYLNAMGRLAEAEGEAAVIRDLRMKLFVDPADLRAKLDACPASLRRLTEAWADGLNTYLATHPEVHPRVITRFEPWMALSFTEGSIGGDVETISLDELAAFYAHEASKEGAAPAAPREPTGSNGFAIAGKNTASGKAMLLINPHTSFFFRAEAHVSSDEGLDAYGAVTWGQFFVYQGWNARAGWMHTSSGVDAVDEYAETIVRRGASGEPLAYRYGSEERPIARRTVVVPYKTAGGAASKTFTVYSTHHGPVVREAGGKWITVRLMQEPVKALIQSFTRTKATSYAAFRDTMELHTNSSNNTVFAGADGDIAYFHANHVPRRDARFDWSRPVDGSDPATEWRGVHSLDETPFVRNPATGWIQNTNDWPFSAAGPSSPHEKDFPPYMDRAGENARGLHAVRVLTGARGLTLDGLIALAYDPYLTGFERLVPALLADYAGLLASDPRSKRLAGEVAALRGWDLRWSAASAPTSLAVFWGEDLWQRVKAGAEAQRIPALEYMVTKATSAERLASLAAASDALTRDFGSWRTPWGEINRLQRTTGDIVQPFDDAKPSIPVPFTSARWGSLASFGASARPGTKKLYGTTGNSFVAVVEFGDRVRAKAVTVGGESGHPGSKHFGDQAGRYAAGALRDVYFYPDELRGHIERTYRPGI